MSGLCSSRPESIGLAGSASSAVHRLDPRAKLIGLLAVTVVAVSAPVTRWPVYAACGATLVVVAATARVGPAVIWRRARAMLPLILFVAAFVPFFRHGGTRWSLGPFTVSEAGLEVLGAVSAKATIGTISAVLLGATTSFPDVLRAMERLRVPRLFTLIAAFMYRYLFVIVGELQRMRTALIARAYRPRHMLQAGAVGRVATAMFLRSYRRGERVYLAMLARGYSGTMPATSALAFRRADALFLGAIAIGLIGVRILVELRP
jgi:cobalt/nickel transport system permease protein